MTGWAEAERAVLSARRRDNASTLISNELIVLELSAFLRARAPGGRVLDLGAGTKPYAPLYERVFEEAVSVDVAFSPHDLDVDVIAEAADLPFEDGAFDAVICTEVLEHCADPLAVMAEIRRVLRPQGSLFLTTPFLVGLHEMPHDYFRFTPSGLEQIAERTGFEIASMESRGDLGAVSLLNLQFPLAKALQATRRLPGDWYRYENPLVYLLLVAPQLLYLRYWRRARRRPASLLGRVARYASRSTLGYITVLRAR